MKKQNFNAMSKVAATCLAAVCIGLMLSTSAQAGVLASGFNSGDWNSGTLPWGAHTDHGSEYYQSWNSEFGNGVLTLHSIYNSGGHPYESGVSWSKVNVPAGGYSYVTASCQIYNPNAGVRGCWPAFWLDSAGSWPPEIDIAEFKGNTGGMVWQNVDDDNNNWTTFQNSINASQWHTYSASIGPATGGNRAYQLFLDGALKGSGQFWDPQGPQFWVICNYAMEGDSGSPGPNHNTYVQFQNYQLTTTSNSTSISNGNHAVIPQNDTGARLDANGWSGNNGAKVQIWNGSTQTWQFTNQGGSLYKVSEAWNTNACLDVNNFGGPGTNAQIWSCNGGTSQQWAAHNDGGNIYEFEPECSFGSRLDVLNGSSGNGTQVRIWYANGASAQKWAVN